MAETTQSDNGKGGGGVTMLTNRKVEKVSTDRRMGNYRYRTLFATRRALVTRCPCSSSRFHVCTSPRRLFNRLRVPRGEITRRRYVAYVDTDL